MTLELHLKPTTPDCPTYLVGGQQMVWQLDHFMWVPYAQDCWHCGQPTTWIDLDFQTALHPGPCSASKWDEYAWAEMFAHVRSPEFRSFVEELRGKMDAPG